MSYDYERDRNPNADVERGRGGDWSQDWSRDWVRDRDWARGRDQWNPWQGGPYGQGYGDMPGQRSGPGAPSGQGASSGQGYGGMPGQRGQYGQQYSQQYGPGYGMGQEYQGLSTGNQGGQLGQGYGMSGMQGMGSMGRGELWNMPGPHTGKGPQNYQRSDERIREDVCDRLTQNGQVDATNITINVSNAEVWLEGGVENRQALRLAEDIAEAVSGVRDVHNNLRVRQGVQA